MSDSRYSQQAAYNSLRNVPQGMHPQTSQDTSAYYGNAYHTPSPHQHPTGQQLRRSSDQSSPYQPAQSPYRPRPSPTPNGGSGETRFCPHGTTFDCGYGCHANANPSSPSAHGSPNPHYPPSPTNRTTSPFNPSKALGRPGHASLPSRMAPGSSVDANATATYPASSPSPQNPPQGMHGPPYGQSRYAGLPDRMAPDPCPGASPDASRFLRRG